MGEGKDQKGKLLLIIGALCVVGALMAGVIGIDAKSGFGWERGLLLIAGLGLVWMGKKSYGCCSKESSDSQDPAPPSDQTRE